MPRKSYTELLRGPRWQKLRLHVFDRDGWKCRVCNAEDQTLHAHHTVYQPHPTPPWDYDPDTIVSLCEHCHQLETDQLKTAQIHLLTELALSGFWSANHLSQLALDLEIKRAIESRG